MLSCADSRIIFVLGSLGLLPRSLKIKRTNEVIDDLDFPDFHPLLLLLCHFLPQGFHDCL